MIGKITGTLLEKHPPQVLIDVNGLGYEVDVPMSTFYNLPGIGEKVSLSTHMVVREDAHLLYGFGSEDERSAFRQLLKVSGVGAKMALAVLSGMTVSDLARAVAEQDTGRFVKVPGIGKKTAERLMLELRDKLPGMAITGAIPTVSGSGTDVINALLSLGYNEKEATWAVKQLPSDVSLTDGIRQALKYLSKP